MNAKIIIVLALAAVVAADGPSYRPRYGSDSHSFESNSFESYESDEAQYDFDWQVQHGPSRNDFGQQESRNGDETRGSYYVQLPDGRRQTVTYGVQGGSGYIADVQYEGDAHYDSDSGSYSFESGSFESYERPRYYN